MCFCFSTFLFEIHRLCVCVCLVCVCFYALVFFLMRIAQSLVYDSWAVFLGEVLFLKPSLEDIGRTHAVDLSQVCADA